MPDEPQDGTHDPLPAMIANLDQVIATAPHLARVARGLFDAFTGAGFAEKQALYLTASHLISTPGSAP